MSKKAAPAEDVPAPPETQPVLFDLPAADFVATLEAKGEYTGERLKAQRPETYQQVIYLLSQGHGSQYIQDKTGVSKNTVKAIRRAEGETIDLLKARMAERNFDFAELATESAYLVLAEIMESRARRHSLSIKDVQSLQVAAGIATQNGQLLSGKPTANINVDVFAHPSEDLNAQIAAHIDTLRSAATHLPPEKPGQKAPLVVDVPTSEPALALDPDHADGESAVPYD